MDNALIVFAKYPIPGFVKTRLARDIGNDAAASLYRQFITYTIRKFARPDRDYKLIVAVAQEQYVARFSLDFPGADQYVSQCKGELGARMQLAIKQCLDDGFKKIAVIGTDSPHLPVALVQDAFEVLNQNDVVIGPADDGGYYLLAVKDNFPFLFHAISWGTEQVLKQTKAVIDENKLTPAYLPENYDIDNIKNLRRLFKDAPEILKGTAECLSKEIYRQMSS
ncbi:MAG: TIGR04282 family arsenosugar biosynthesis glycosyltransferase [bacterium]